MKYGYCLPFKIRDKLERLGYRKMPTHAYSNMEVDAEWVQGLDILGNPSFPRYHIIKKDDKTYLHCDWDREHSRVISEGDIIKRELWRIQNIFIK